MSLATDLAVLGEVIQPRRWGESLGFLDPRLKTAYSPRVTWKASQSFERVVTAKDLSPWPDLAEAQPEPLGLSLAPNSKRPPRYGLQGLPAAGRKQVWRALALLEEDRRLLSFWTVSLPTTSLLALARADSLPEFQDRLRKELARKLQRAGLPVRLVGVVELQPRRSHAAGIPCPHWHVVFQGRKSPGHHWALSPADLDEVIRAALASAGAPAPDGIDGAAFLKAAGNVQQVKKSVRAYLSKYMTKGSGDTARWVGTEAETLLPRQWWFWSRPLREFVLAHVFPIAFGFLRWVHEHRRDIEEAGLARFRILPLSDERAPLTYEISWLRTSFVAELVAVWQEDEWDEKWWKQFRLTRSLR
jgi:hypothetical protein